jgi:hypothetical protein
MYLDCFVPERFSLLKPILCNSATEAASIVCGSKVSGPQKWFEQESRMIYQYYKKLSSSVNA